MDFTPYVSAFVAAVVAYIAMRVSTERHFASIEARQAAQDEQIHQAMEEAHIGRELSVQIAELSTKMDLLTASVDKQAEVMQKTIVLERDVSTMWKRHDELKRELHDFKVGGTK